MTADHSASAYCLADDVLVAAVVVSELELRDVERHDNRADAMDTGDVEHPGYALGERVGDALIIVVIEPFAKRARLALTHADGTPE